MRVEALSQVSQLYKAAKPKKTENEGRTGKTSDTLEISQAGRDYQIAKQAVREAPDIREDKIERIKAAMAAGTYQVSARDVADKMVESYYETKSW